MKRTALGLLLVSSVVSTLLCVPGTAAAQRVTVQERVERRAEPASTQDGYLTLSDGAKLKYTVLLPAGKGPFPVLMQYDGYYAGSDPARVNEAFVGRMLEKGYAVLGVSLRGSACSDGVWTLFDRQQGRDGAEAVEWAGTQPWSNGRVAMFSFSYAGIMQPWVAAERPEHLVAIAPGSIVTDTFRDIGYPGGMYNQIFPPAWSTLLNENWAVGVQNDPADTACATNVAQHLALNAPNHLAINGPQHPTDDAWHRQYSIVHRARRIDVPALVVRQWQDEETGSRIGSIFDRMDPEKTWLLSSNGHHSMYGESPSMHAELERFFDFHVKGIRNGFGSSPHVQVWHETASGTLSPRSTTTQRELPVTVRTRRLFLSGDGGLIARREATAGAASFLYPEASPTVLDPSAVGEENQSNAWSLSTHDPLGRATFTSPPLERTVTTFGSASADLWISTTAAETDLQVTMTEVRPDGQEMYVQRGWLRGSHRALDAKRSTPLAPWHPHTADSIAPMPAGEAQLMRIEVMPFGHTFRAGSSIRLYVEYPGITGLWGFVTDTTPQQVTVHTGENHPSSLVLGLLPGARVEQAPPPCGTVHSQPCRTNTVESPAGTLRLRD